MLDEKNVIMTISTGRSGTGLLADLLSLCEDTLSVHEPSPTFQDVFEGGMAPLDRALEFCRDVKLPAIEACGSAHYAETSHYFGQGFLDAFVTLGVPLKIIILNRDPRAVAKSFERIKCVPVKTAKGLALMPHPEGEGSALPANGWERFSDYQLCYWYCLETEQRKQEAKARASACGLGVVEIGLDDLLDFKAFLAMTAALGLELCDGAEVRHRDIAATKVNRKGKYLPKVRLTNLDEREREVWASIGPGHEDLRAAVEARYGAL